MVMAFSLIIVVVDTTVLNVTIPTLQRELNASASDLQWIVESYVVVLAGVILTMGALGDRFGRKRAFQSGLLIFGTASAIAAFATTSGQLIAARSLMGVGAALITPASLAVIVDVFPPAERGKAIGIWTAVAGLGMPIGPLVGGYLLENFWWGSVFFINVPIVAVALIAGAVLVPESRNPIKRGIDILGAVLSIITLSSLVFAIIEAPSRGWSDPLVLGLFAGSVLLGVVFVLYELRVERPMLDLRYFKNPGFSTGSIALGIAFMSLIGMAFILTQYLQVVREYGPFSAGLRLLPMAVGLMLGASNSNRLVSRLGTRWVVTFGLVMITSALAALSFIEPATPYWMIGIVLFVLGIGMGNTMAPSTTAIMGAVPAANAGVGSAVGNAARQVGMALGVGILGSVVNSIYASRVAEAVSGLPTESATAVKNSVGAAAQVAASIGGPVGDAIRSSANVAFVDGFGAAMLVGAAIVLVAAVPVAMFMPGRKPSTDSKTANPTQMSTASASAAPMPEDD